MASVKHGPFTVDTVTVRRKPVFTYQSPAQNTAISHPEKSSPTPQSGISLPPLVSTSPPTPSQVPELSQISAVTHKSSRSHMTMALLPLYHPFGALALSLPDLDPSAFGLPAPVAVFDDPTRRFSNRQRRPAAKVRDADAPTRSHSPSLVAETPVPEPEVKEKPSPRRRRGGGPGGKRKRREHEDGDATYPAKRPRNPRSSGVASGLSGSRTLSKEGSPALSNAHSGVSPALDGSRGDTTEEKKPERRKTRSRGAIVRRDSTTSEETTTTASQSASAGNTATPRAGSGGGEADEPTTNDGSNETTASGGESKKADADDTPVPEPQES